MLYKVTRKKGNIHPIQPIFDKHTYYYHEKIISEFQLYVSYIGRYFRTFIGVHIFGTNELEQFWFHLKILWSYVKIIIRAQLYPDTFIFVSFAY